MVCHFLFQGIFPTQRLNPPALGSPKLAGGFFATWEVNSLPPGRILCHLGSPQPSVLSLESCPTLSDPVDCNLPGSCIHGILLEWGAISSSRGSSQPRDGTCISALQEDSLLLSYWGSLNLLKRSEEKVAQLCLCNPMDCSPPGSSSVQGDSPGKNTGEFFCRGSSRPRVSCTAGGFFS